MFSHWTYAFPLALKGKAITVDTVGVPGRNWNRWNWDRRSWDGFCWELEVVGLDVYPGLVQLAVHVDQVENQEFVSWTVSGAIPKVISCNLYSHTLKWGIRHSPRLGWQFLLFHDPKPSMCRKCFQIYLHLKTGHLQVKAHTYIDCMRWYAKVISYRTIFPFLVGMGPMPFWGMIRHTYTINPCFMVS